MPSDAVYCLCPGSPEKQDCSSALSSNHNKGDFPVLVRLNNMSFLLHRVSIPSLMLLLGDIVTPIIFIMERKLKLKFFGKSVHHSRCISALPEVLHPSPHSKSTLIRGARPTEEFSTQRPKNWVKIKHFDAVLFLLPLTFLKNKIKF